MISSSSRSISALQLSSRRFINKYAASTSTTSFSTSSWIGAGGGFKDDNNDNDSSKNLTMVSIRNFHSPAVKRHNRRQKAGGSQPSLDIAMSMARNYQEMDNQSLITIAAMHDHDARSEVLKRHIMSIDNVSYEEACETFEKIAAKNREGMFLFALPYYTGVTMAITAGVLSIPMVFHLGTAEWFNEYYVTTDVPEPKDLETALEVGAWTWNWMEPPLGQISFFLLCLQFSRAQMQNLGVKPYTEKLKQIRASNLSKSFPQYDANIVKGFSVTDIISTL